MRNNIKKSNLKFCPVKQLRNPDKQRGSRGGVEKVDSPTGDENCQHLLSTFFGLVEKADSPTGDENGSLSSVVKVLCTVKIFPVGDRKALCSGIRMKKLREGSA